jgi:hypothetical protein
MRIWQLLAGAGIVWALQAGCLLYVRSWLGFPDGSQTELARVRRQIYPVLSALFAAAALLSWVLAFRSYRAGTSRAGKAALWALPLAGTLFWIFDRWLAASLDDGGGG